MTPYKGAYISTAVGAGFTKQFVPMFLSDDEWETEDVGPTFDTLAEAQAWIDEHPRTVKKLIDRPKIDRVWSAAIELYSSQAPITVVERYGMTWFQQGDIEVNANAVTVVVYGKTDRSG